MAFLREATGMALEGAYAGLALLGATATVLAGTPADVLLPFWLVGLVVVVAPGAGRGLLRRVGTWRRGRR